jgi:3-methyladenine DNA glycosylase AlkD
LWWAIGNGDGAYRDSRLTVGTRGSAIEDDSNWITLCFLVSDNGKLTAYLDAEDNDLLYNTPAFEKNEVNGYKRLSQWDVGVTEEQELAAFESALKIIDKFFNDGNEMLYDIIDDATSSYSQQDLERLEKLLASRETQTFDVWDDVSESNLQSAYAEQKQLKKNIEYYEGAKQAAIMVKDKSSVMEVDTKLEALNKRLAAVETDIRDMEEDKLNYMKRFKDAKTQEKESEPERRKNLISALGLTAEEADKFTTDQLKDLARKKFTKYGNIRKRFRRGDMATQAERYKSAQDWEKTKQKFADDLFGTPKLTKTGKVRKQRAVKTGDVADLEAKEKENARKSTKQAAKGFSLSDDDIAELLAGL